jgi:hypothetical protein
MKHRSLSFIFMCITPFLQGDAAQNLTDWRGKINVYLAPFSVNRRCAS